MARLTVFKQVAVGKPNLRTYFVYGGNEFIALVTIARPETRRSSPLQVEATFQGGGGPKLVLVYLLR